MEERRVEIKCNGMAFENASNKVKLLFDFLIKDVCDIKIFNKMYKDSQFSMEEIILSNFRNYLFKTKQRGQVELKEIQYCYQNEQHIQLKRLLQEKFLQLFSKQEYKKFLELFKRNNWTWIDLINEFDKDECKNSIFAYLSCENTNVMN